MRGGGDDAEVLRRADAHSARSAGTWLAGESHADARAGVRDQRLADRLARWTEVLAALRSGALTVGQAEAITTALDALPADLDSELVAKATGRRLPNGDFGFPRRC